MHGLQSALKERGIDKMLEEAREDHKESDQLHMRRKCKANVYSYIPIPDCTNSSPE